jgi:hypothetical protein
MSVALISCLVAPAELQLVICSPQIMRRRITGMGRQHQLFKLRASSAQSSNGPFQGRLVRRELGNAHTIPLSVSLRMRR